MHYYILTDAAGKNAATRGGKAWIKLPRGKAVVHEDVRRFRTKVEAVAESRKLKKRDIHTAVLRRDSVLAAVKLPDGEVAHLEFPTVRAARGAEKDFLAAGALGFGIEERAAFVRGR